MQNEDLIAEAIWAYCNPGFAPMGGPQHPDWDHYVKAAVQAITWAETEPMEDREALLAEADALVESWDHKGSWSADSPVGLVMRLARELRRGAPAEPAVTEPVPVTIAARRAGKTQALIENLLAQANEHGIHVKVEYGNAVTDAQVLVALNAWYAKEREQNGWPIGSNATELADYSPQAQDRMRAALRAAFTTRGADDE